MLTAIVVATLAAFSAGFLDAIAGGGGIIAMPTLLMLGLPVGEVLGTNKLQSSAGTSVAAMTYAKRGAVIWPIAKIAIPLAALGGLVGAFIVLRVPSDFLRPLVFVLVFALAAYLILRPRFGADSSYAGIHGSIKWIVGASAVALGFYDGFFGPGTGMFITYLLVRYLGLDFVRAAGTTKAINLASNLAPLCYFISQGAIRYEFGIPMAAANILGGYLGAHSALRAGPALVRWISAAMALALSVKLLIDWVG